MIRKCVVILDFSYVNVQTFKTNLYPQGIIAQIIADVIRLN